MIYKFDLSELEFHLLRDFIHTKFGIYFKDEKLSFMRMKLYPRIISLGLNSFHEYYNLLKYGKQKESETRKIISLLTNNETYFFREDHQLKVFRDSLLSILMKRKQVDKKIRILSAGCSTGEEVYSLAMLIFETGNFFWGWNIEVIGLDVDENALAQAKRGVYYKRSLRMTDPTYIRKFFSDNSDIYSLKNTINKMTSFRQGNLLDPETWINLNIFDIIFCRNVLIYFSEEKMNVVLKNCYRALGSEGYLLLGHSETLTDISSDFEPVRFPHTIVYKKKELIHVS